MDLSKLSSAALSDAEAERDGVWLTFDPALDVRVRSSNNEAFKLALRKAYRRFQHMGRNLLPQQEDAIRREAFAKAGIVDWRGEATAGEPYTPERGLDALKALPKLLRFVNESADNEDLFGSTEGDDLGNSKPTSTGSENGAALNV